jgi:hypothetical protein
VAADGSSVISKHEGTGGLVSVGTVTAQLLYEIGGPRYLNPDVVARFDTIRLEPAGPDRVRISGVVGEPPPPDLKVCINYVGGYRNSVTFVLTGDAIEEKAELARRTLLEGLGGEEAFEKVDVRLSRVPAESRAELSVTVRDPDPTRVGRAFSNAAVEMTLASYPGMHLTAPPGAEASYGVYWPALLPADHVEQFVVGADGSRTPVVDAGPAARRSVAADEPEAVGAPAPVAPPGSTRRAHLGRLFGARSGDKGGAANVGVWARDEASFTWLQANLTAERFAELVPESAPFAVERFVLPNLRAINFVVPGLLGEGVAASTRPDPQAKGLGELLRSCEVDLPESLLVVERLEAP